MQLTAPIIPLVLVFDEQAGLTLWAPPHYGPAGEVWESFLGRDPDPRVSLFPTASHLHAFISGPGADAFAGHPAWPGIRRRSPAQLRALPHDVVDLDRVYQLAEQPPSPPTVAALSRAVQLVAAVAGACGDGDLVDYLGASGFSYLLDVDQQEIQAWGTAYASRRNARDIWQSTCVQIVQHWEAVLDRFGYSLEWLGDFTQADTEELITSAYPMA